MSRFLSKIMPKTMLGQAMLILAIGLLVGQLISATLLLRADEQRRAITVANEVTLRFVNAERREAAREERRAQRMEQRLEERASRRPNRRGGRNGRNGRNGERFRGGVQISENWPAISGDISQKQLETLLQDMLSAQGIAVSDLIVVKRKAGRDPALENRRLLRGRLRGRLRNQQGSDDWRSGDIVVAGIKREGAKNWEIARTVHRKPPREVLYMLGLQTLVIFAVLFALIYIMMRRSTRPLAQLTSRVDAFSRNPDEAAELEPSGPEDIRRLITAHNAMEARVASLLDEKDVMLGAIGHDLKTPLAALRVRIESVEDDVQRERMAGSIQDITHTLDDILSLARIGRSGVEAERVDLSALTASVVEEFEDLSQDVTLTKGERCVREVQVTWLKRALRNLISNAVRYGKEAQVSLLTRDGRVIIRVDDKGPGIPEEAIAAMLEPFHRGEASRNRATGGAGLGLTLARAIAEQHGGELVLSNRPEGGLRAEIRLA
jgi:signal transduction histidine kinase